jgi:trigger factor
MATVTRENVGKLQDRITVKVAKEDYFPSFEKSLKNYAKTASVPGFRKGMVPVGMVKKMYGQSIFNDEIIRNAGEQLENYLREQKLGIFGKPMLLPNETPLQLDMNAPADVDFTFEVGLKPEFSIPAIDAKKAISKYKIEVSDKQVDTEVDRLSRRFGKVEDQEVVTKGDDILYNYYQSCDENGNVAEGAEKIEDTVLLEKLPAKLQALLNGKKVDESIVIRPVDVCTEEELKSFLKDPLKKDESAAEQYFKLTITKIGLLIPAEVNEELFAQVFQNVEVKDEADFKDRIRQELGREYERVTLDRLNNEIYEVLVHQTPFELPVDFLKRWLMDGQDKPKSAEEVEKEFPGFEHQLRWTLISDKLIMDNNIQVSMEDVNADIKGRVLAYFGIEAGDEAPWMEGYMQKIAKDEKTLNETYQRLMFDKLFQFLHTQFAISEQTVSEEEFMKLSDPHTAHHHHH